MSFNHGINTRETSVSSFATEAASSGIPFVVGTAPIHTVKGAVNKPVVVNSINEAKAMFGYSDDWEKYTLCEVMDSHFKLYRKAPVVMVNVLDPEKHITQAEVSEEVTLISKKVTLPFEAIDSQLSVQNGEVQLVKGTDYDTFYSDDALVEMLSKSKHQYWKSYILRNELLRRGKNK